MSHELTTIPNAAPIVYERGVEDNSKRAAPIRAEAIPDHCATWYLQTPEGAPGHTFLDSSNLVGTYGRDAFNLTGPYANHQTVGALTNTGEGNSCFIHRVTDGTYSTITLCLDILQTHIPLFERMEDGSFKRDPSGSRIPTGSTAPGIIAKWILVADGLNPRHRDLDNGTALTGNNHKLQGTLVDPNDDQNTSFIYPILDVPAATPGKIGDLSGFRFFTPRDVDRDEVRRTKSFLYTFQIIKRDSDFTNTSIVRNIYNSTQSTVSFRHDAANSFDNAPYFLPYKIEDTYQNLGNPNFPLINPALGEIHLYREYVDEIHEMVSKHEEYHRVTEIEGRTWQDSDEEYSKEHAFLMNIVSGTDEYGVPYNTFVIDENITTNSVRLSPRNNIMLRGGKDNILDVKGYEAYVRRDMLKYADYDSEYQDHARFVDSVFWDTGFTVPTKEYLCNYIHARYDTFLVLSTFVDNKDKPRDFLSEEEELSVALNLRSYLRMHPESDYFGTGVFRAMVIGGSGFIVNSMWRRRATLAFDYIEKFSKYMGAGNGIWKTTESFSYAPGNIIKSMRDISIPWIPPSRRIDKWDVGLNLPLYFNRRNMFWPGTTTIADDPSSVLNSPMTAMAVCYLNKAAHAAWRQYTGIDDATDAQLESFLNDFISNRVFGKFDSRFVIIPRALHRTNDVKRGYSWTLPIEIYANNMKTVETTYVRVFRMEDLNR